MKPASSRARCSSPGIGCARAARRDTAPPAPEPPAGRALDPICLLVAGVVRASLPAPEFTLAWTHSVQKTRWEERYRADGDGLRLAEARVEGSGAGMEPPASAVLRDGAWVWHPETVIPELRITRSAHAGDYTLCWSGSCRGLSTLVGSIDDGTVVAIRPCRRGERTR